MNDDDKIRFGRLRGGRITKTHKSKKTYNRKRDKKNIEKDIKNEQ